MLAGLPGVVAQQAKVTQIRQAIIPSKSVDGAAFVKMVESQSFSGYAHRIVMKDGPVYIFAKGQGEIAQEGNTIVLPRGASEVVFLVMNPKPDNPIGLRMSVNIDKDNCVSICDLSQNSPADYLAVRTPISTLLQGTSVWIVAFFGKSATSSGGGSVLEDAAKFAARYCSVSFRQ